LTHKELSMTTNGQAQTTDPAHPNEYTTVLPQEILVERVFPAPRELVFRVWTECEHLQHWWGPTGWTLPHCTVDLRPGGKWHYCMQGHDGTEAWGITLYREIVRPERLVYTDAFSDAEGNLNPTLPQIEVTVEFADEGGQTRVTSRSRYNSQAELETVLKMGVVEGFTMTLDRADAYLRELTAQAGRG
jgi:uncharacterized protein YndB with AHSA1/START domain